MDKRQKDVLKEVTNELAGALDEIKDNQIKLASGDDREFEIEHILCHICISITLLTSMALGEEEP